MARLYFDGLDEARYIHHRLSAEGVITNYETRARTSDDSPVPIILSAVPLPEGGSVGFLEDLSDVQNARIANTLLRASLESIGAISESTTVRTAIERILHSLADALSPQGITGLELHMYDRERSQFQAPPFVVGEGDQSRLSDRIVDSTLERILSGEKPTFVRDATQVLCNPPRSSAERVSDRGLAICPLRDGYQLVGALVCYHRMHQEIVKSKERLIDTLAELAGVAVGKALLYDQTRSHAKRLKALNEIGTLITKEPKLDTVFNLTVEQALHHFEADATSLMLWDDKGEYLEIKAQQCLSDEYSSAQRIPRARVDEELGILMKDGGLRCIVRDLREASFGDLDLIVEEDLQTVMIAPLQKQGQVAGVLNVYSKVTPRQFSRSDLEMAQSFANQVANAVHNANLYEQQARAARELRLLAEFASTVGIVKEEHLLVKAAVKLTGDLINKPMHVGLVDGNRVIYDEFGAHGFPERETPLFSQSIYEGIAGAAISERQAIIVPNLNADARAVSPPSGMKSQASVPLQIGDEVLGALNVYDKNFGGVDENDLRVLQPVASQLAVGLKYAKVFRNHCAVEKLDMLSQLGAFLAHRMSNIVGTLPWQMDEIAAAIPPDEKDVWEHVNGIKSDIAYLLNLAQELRRIPADESVYPSIAVDVNRWLEEALKSVRLQNVEVVRQMEDSLPWVNAQPVLLGDVLLSLMQNAVAAMGSEGTLTLRTRQSSSGRWVYVEVKDTGHGMTEAEKRRIFAPYFSHRRNGEGMGLALWLAKLLLQSWGGDIDVLHTAPDEGTVFSVRLPCPAAPIQVARSLAPADDLIQEPPLANEHANRHDQGYTKRILVADDTESWRRTLVQLLKGRGHSVHSAASYGEAVAILERHPVDIAVLDIRLVDSDERNQDGLRLARQVVALNPRAVSIVLTGFDVPAQVEAMKEQGIILGVIRKKQPKADFDEALLAALTKPDSLEAGQPDGAEQMPGKET